jgi:hypothetical protein
MLVHISAHVFGYHLLVHVSAHVFRLHSQLDWPLLFLGTFILKGGPVDEAQMLLDDHIVKSQAMTASPFAKPFIEKLAPWERKLVRFQV